MAGYTLYAPPLIRCKPKVARTSWSYTTATLLHVVGFKKSKQTTFSRHQIANYIILYQICSIRRAIVHSGNYEVGNGALCQVAPPTSCSPWCLEANLTSVTEVRLSTRLLLFTHWLPSPDSSADTTWHNMTQHDTTWHNMTQHDTVTHWLPSLDPSADTWREGHSDHWSLDSTWSRYFFYYFILINSVPFVYK